MKKTLIATIVLAALAAPLLAQEERHPGPPVPCPHPVSVVILAGTTPPTPDQMDLGPQLYPTSVGSQWNQTAVNKHFGHTFHFAKECCLMTSGTLTVKIKALQGGPAKSATSANDAVNLVSNKTVVQQQQPWINGVSTGATTVVTFNVPASVLSRGLLSIFVQDDTAVLSAELKMTGCCIR